MLVRGGGLLSQVWLTLLDEPPSPLLAKSQSTPSHLEAEAGASGAVEVLAATAEALAKAAAAGWVEGAGSAGAAAEGTGAGSEGAAASGVPDLTAPDPGGGPRAGLGTSAG